MQVTAQDFQDLEARYESIEKEHHLLLQTLQASEAA